MLEVSKSAMLRLIRNQLKLLQGIHLVKAVKMWVDKIITMRTVMIGFIGYNLAPSNHVYESAGNDWRHHVYSF